MKFVWLNLLILFCIFYGKSLFKTAKAYFLNESFAVKLSNTNINTRIRSEYLQVIQYFLIPLTALSFLVIGSYPSLWKIPGSISVLCAVIGILRIGKERLNGITLALIRLNKTDIEVHVDPSIMIDTLKKLRRQSGFSFLYKVKFQSNKQIARGLREIPCFIMDSILVLKKEGISTIHISSPWFLKPEGLNFFLTALNRHQSRDKVDISLPVDTRLAIPVSLYWRLFHNRSLEKGTVKNGWRVPSKQVQITLL